MLTPSKVLPSEANYAVDGLLNSFLEVAIKMVATMPNSPTNENIDATAPARDSVHSLRLEANTPPKIANILKKNEVTIIPP